VHGLAVSPGVRSLEALCARARGGLYVEELSGTHTMNEVTGELSLGCSGWVLRGGERAEPFEGATLAGTLLRLLGDGVELSMEREVVDDARVPAVLLEDVPVASTG
jgi:PmbA protein